jgi:hypothetical protein
MQDCLGGANASYGSTAKGEIATSEAVGITQRPFTVVKQRCPDRTTER